MEGAWPSTLMGKAARVGQPATGIDRRSEGRFGDPNSVRRLLFIEAGECNVRILLKRPINGLLQIQDLNFRACALITKRPKVIESEEGRCIRFFLL